MNLRNRAGLGLAASLLAAPALAQPANGEWQACAAVAEPSARLACFDTWAARQPPAAGTGAAQQQPVAGTGTGQWQPAAGTRSGQQQPAGTGAAVAVAPRPSAPGEDEGCHDPEASDFSRFWELERRTGCGTFYLRSYRPNTLSLVTADRVNKQPTSGNPANAAATAQDFRTFETRIQLSVRSKLAQGLLRDGELRDSLWFGYTQQSYWQLFTPGLSRPFRSTDHEPELLYVYPFDQAVPGSRWRLRYGGLGLVHQSNGQSLPYSRSWNRAYLTAGAEHPGGWSLQGRVWRRFHEDAATDDNPEISDYIGRAEFTAGWNRGRDHSWFLTWRTPLNRMDHGSLRLQWLVPVRSPFSGTRFGNLNLHTQLFTGYGDTLLDYNKPRTVLSVGLSLFDW